MVGHGQRDEQAPGDAVGEVPEAQGGGAEVFESAVECLGRSVGGAWSVEVGEHVDGAFGQGLTQRDQLDQRLGDTVAQVGSQLGH